MIISFNIKKYITELISSLIDSKSYYVELLLNGVNSYINFLDSVKHHGPFDYKMIIQY